MRADGMTDPDPPDLDAAVLDLDVGHFAHGGHCLARAGDGRIVFVRHALPGERVRARVTEQRREYLRADAIEVLDASPDRVTPPCPWAGPDRCGGCDLQHVAPAAQAELKAAVVREQLVRLGGMSAAEVAGVRVRTVDGPADGTGWRTRVRYTVDSTSRAGLLKHRSHEVVPVDRCLIAHPAVGAAAVLDRTWPDADAVEVVASATGEVTVLSHRGAGRTTRVSGPPTAVERAVGREWTVPVGSFWQVHPAAADTLADAVLATLEPRPGERAWDLYGGVGLFAAALAARIGPGGVTLVEGDARAAAAARRNVRGVTVVQSDVERAVLERARPRLPDPDIVVLDPPRAGAGRRVVRALVDRAPRAVAYVACDPAALARDVRTFRDAGWRLAGLTGYDLFPMTHHVECVARLVPPDGSG
jgi:tRNA/tmRNA/rRNA uracil-C5-methylase (TrmA/RlmC/RlmD family)